MFEGYQIPGSIRGPQKTLSRINKKFLNNNHQVTNSKKKVMIIQMKNVMKDTSARNHSMGLIAQAHGFGIDKTPNAAIKALRKAASKDSNEFAKSILALCEASVDTPDSGVTGEVRFTQDSDMVFLSDEEHEMYLHIEAHNMAQEAAAKLNFSRPLLGISHETVIRQNVG